MCRGKMSIGQAKNFSKRNNGVTSESRGPLLGGVVER